MTEEVVVDSLSDAWEQQYEEVTQDWRIKVESEWPRKLVAIGIVTAITVGTPIVAPIFWASATWHILRPKKRRLHLAVHLPKDDR